MSVVTHDLRSHASAIQAGADLLLGGVLGELNPRQTHTLQLVRRNALRQTRLITDLLDLTVIEAGELPLRMGRGTMSGLVGAAIEEIEPLIAEKHLTIRAEIDPDTALPCDPDRIAQALGNLLSNAMRFARTEIAVEVRKRGDRVEVVIEDDGPGIPPDQAERIFEWYVRGSGSGGGTGLGLPIVRGIARAHRGDVTAENRLGGGARFTLVLPLR
jgi:signal transduction histidine kinase